MKPAYQNLCTEFYNLTMPEAGPNECAFYLDLLQDTKGPILEAMCGSGRLLIPLLKSGLIIDGVDNSPHMLASCRHRCQIQGFSVQLYEQPIENLSLPKKYSLIFIAFGSFQLISDRTEALRTLKNLHEHLLPGGKLVIETSVPWDGIKNCIHGAVLSHGSAPFVTEHKVKTPEGFEIINHATLNLSLTEQLVFNQTRYEKWDRGNLLLSEEEEYTIRWYHRFEMELMLEKAGFSSIEIKDTSFEENPQALVYTAIKDQNSC